MKKNKIKIGIELDEVIRNKFLNFDRYYYDEFGGDGVPENESYVYDLFKDYKWETTEETVKYLKDDAPDDMSIKEYHNIDDKDVDTKGDEFLFDSVVEKTTGHEKFNKFLYVDYCLEIHGNSPMMYKNLNVDIQKLIKEYEGDVEFVLISKENQLSIPSTLFFLSKNAFKFKEIKFVDNYDDVLDFVDLYITSNPELINKKNIINVRRPYNSKLIDITSEKFNILQISDLIGNVMFKSMVLSKMNTTKIKRLIKNIIK